MHCPKKAPAIDWQNSTTAEPLSSDVVIAHQVISLKCFRTLELKHSVKKSMSTCRYSNMYQTTPSEATGCDATRGPFNCQEYSECASI